MPGLDILHRIVRPEMNGLQGVLNDGPRPERLATGGGRTRDKGGARPGSLGRSARID